MREDEPNIIETKQFTYKEFILTMREMTAEMKMMRSELTRFNLFIANISQKAGQLGVAKSLIDMFVGATGKTGK